MTVRSGVGLVFFFTTEYIPASQACASRRRSASSNRPCPSLCWQYWHQRSMPQAVARHVVMPRLAHWGQTPRRGLR
ncbi:MAG: hypothetical protein WAQ05_15375 [Rubrivivax sp.]